MIVVYTRDGDIIRLEDVTNIEIVEISSSLSYVSKAIDIYKEMAEEYEKENVLFKERIIGRVALSFDVKASGECYMKMGFKYIVIIEGKNRSFNLPVKEIGNPSEIEKLKTMRDKIKYIVIDEEKGVLTVE